MSLIKVEQLYKRYRIQHDRSASIKEALMAHLRGRAGVYEEFWALKGVDLTVREGEAWAILGRNGSGKTTLLSLIGGIILPTAGTVWTRGKVSMLMGVGSGFDPRLTGVQNAYLYGSLLGMSRQKIRSSLDEILAFAELENFADVRVRSYSQGMQARLAFSVASTMEADVLLIDEVLAVGDTAFQVKCLERMNEIKARVGAIVMVTHAVSTVRRWCTHAIWLHEGRVRQMGAAGDVANAYAQAFTEGVAGAISPEQMAVI